MTLQEAIEVYLSAKGKNKGKSFKAAVDRARTFGSSNQNVSA